MAVSATKIQLHQSPILKELGLSDFSTFNRRVRVAQVG
jgi:hypothetical protein